MVEAGSRGRTQAPPPHVVAEALLHPDRDPARPWLRLLEGERRPRVIDSDPPGLVVWSSPWPGRPDASVRFDLASDGHGGTHLRWTLLMDDPLPDAPELGHLRSRLNKLINADLRYSFGQ